ncbi:MAG: hypothetical protein AAF743_10695 [Planctomycetota bacterium]
MRKLICTIGLLAAANTAYAGEVFFQGFETDTAGYFDVDDNWFGQATRVASGTDGITSSSGSFHAVFEQGLAQSNDPADGISAPFTRFDTSRSVWQGGFTAQADVYLDPNAFTTGEGFDYSVAVNRQNGEHLRDFIFHVTKDTSTGSLLIGGSNNTNFDPREDLESLNNFEVTTPGWYTLEHNAYENGLGDLAVDLNLLDENGVVLFTETRTTTADDIDTVVGGNRYAWFTNIDVAGGIAVDNVGLNVIPEPMAALGGLTLLGLVGLRRSQSAT